MNTLPAQEIKRRGVKAIEIAIKDGPVHIIKNNTPTYVVLTEAQYHQLITQHQPHSPAQRPLIQRLLHKGSSGAKTREELDAQLNEERDSWDR
jgi:hypothetical protein